MSSAVGSMLFYALGLLLIQLLVCFSVGLPLYGIAASWGMRCTWMIFIPGLTLFYLLALGDEIRHEQGAHSRLLARGCISLALFAASAAEFFLLGSGLDPEIGIPLLFFIAIKFLSGLLMFVAGLCQALYSIYETDYPRLAALFVVLGTALPIAVPVFLYLTGCRIHMRKANVAAGGGCATPSAKEPV